MSPRSLIFTLIAVALTACSPNKGFQSERFSSEPAIEMLQALSADELRGRKVGTEENARARAMIIDRFKGLGVSPAGNSFEHPFIYGTFADPETGTDAAPAKTGSTSLGELRARRRVVCR